MSKTDGIPYSHTDALDRILKQVCEEKYGLEQELASLREQLKEKELDNLKLRNDLADTLEVKQRQGPTALSMLYNDLKQQEEVTRELTDLLQRLIDGEKSFIKQYPRTSKNIESLLEKAKSLTTKDK